MLVASNRLLQLSSFSVGRAEKCGKIEFDLSLLLVASLLRGLTWREGATSTLHLFTQFSLVQLRALASRDTSDLPKRQRAPFMVGPPVPVEAVQAPSAFPIGVGRLPFQSTELEFRIHEILNSFSYKCLDN